MSKASPFRFAVIADAHYHDIESDFGLDGFRFEDQRLVIRPLIDVARSPRLYNEAGQALRYMLDALVDKQINHVVLLGDYSDDGQLETLCRLEALLSHYRLKHGMRFYAVPGNHDIYGENGRHRRKRYLNSSGEQTLVTSDPALFDPRGGKTVVADGMYCAGYPENLVADCGFFGVADACHWETPFGTLPQAEARLFAITSPDGSVTRKLMDASYLVEPVPGIWFVMIDANVFVPVGHEPEREAGIHDDGLEDSTAAGWSAILRHKPFLLEWLADITRRARLEGKQVLAFSHYPVLDPLDGTLDCEIEMMGRNGFHSRIPGPDVAATFAKTGMTVHFSGHVHVNDTAQWTGNASENALVNVAVPALVAFPAACKIGEVDGQDLVVSTATLDLMPLDPRLMTAYEAEAALDRTGRAYETTAMRAAKNYGTFVSAHLEQIVRRRFLKREWPLEMAALFREKTLADLVQIAFPGHPVAVSAGVEGITALDFLADWYGLRVGSELGEDRIDAERLALYRTLATLGTPEPENGAARSIALLFKTLASHLGGLASRRFQVDLQTGALIRLP